MTVVDILDTERIRRGGKGRGENDRTVKGGVGGTGHFSRRVLGGDTETRLGGMQWDCWCNVGNSNMTGTKDGSRIDQLTK